MANRLSEIENATVLLIEAGGIDSLHSDVDVPLAYLRLQLRKYRSTVGTCKSIRRSIAHSIGKLTLQILHLLQ